MNVHVTGEEEPRSIDWSQVHNWRNVPYPENVVMMTQDEELTQEVVDAKEKEIKDLIENDVFESVQNENQPTISSRWIITEKFKDGKKIVKARLVARGFEEDSSNFTKDSRTCGRECLCLLFATAATMSWDITAIDITAIDITSAFLQGGPIEHEVYLKPPADVCSNETVWHLKRCIYGLNDAPRSWYERVKEVLLSLGATISAYDNALFLWHDDHRGAFWYVSESCG